VKTALLESPAERLRVTRIGYAGEGESR
jgi:hypothetical protein